MHRPIAAGSGSRCASGPTPLEPHPRGRQFTLRTEARVGVSWCGRRPRPTSRRGRRGRRGDPPGRAARQPRARRRAPPGAARRPRAPLRLGVGRHEPDPRPPAQRTAVRLPDARSPTGCGRRLAAWPQLGRELPDAFTVEVAFRKPILLPATVAFAEGRAPDDPRAIAFGVRDARKDTSHLDGLLTPAD